MKKSKIVRLTRKWHRYLGVILGVQFFMWTLGGLYFSWTNINEIRGDHLKNASPIIAKDLSYVSPNVFLENYITDQDSLVSLELSSILKKPIYRVQYKSKGKKEVLLINAITGSKRNPLTQEEAIGVAKQKLKVSAEVTKVEYITETGNHHEYRERPLPAFAITFDQPAHTTVYVSAQYGNVQTFRNNEWRVFDFLWMMHTMDYQERDNFNNIVLRAFSLFGIFTILSGFFLYVLTSKTLQYKIRSKS